MWRAQLEEAESRWDGRWASECKKAEDERGRAGHEKPLAPNSVKGKSQTYVVCAVYPEMHTGGGFLQKHSRSVWCYRTLGHVIVNLIFLFRVHIISLIPAADGERWPRGVSLWISTPLHHQSWNTGGPICSRKHLKKSEAPNGLLCCQRYRTLSWYNGILMPALQHHHRCEAGFRFPIGEVVNLLKWLMCFGAQFVHAALFLASNQ